ncbi:MAG: hypothetical protein ACXV5U_05110 [Ilumatobacteraceae bacterium]
METQRRFRSIVIVGAVMIGSLAAVALLPELSSASSARTTAASTTTTTSTPKTTTKTTATTTTQTTTKTTTNYEVVDGIFTVKANAQARIKALTVAKFKKFTLKPVGAKFAVVHARLTKPQATALVKAIQTAKIGKPRIKKLA